MKLRSLFLAAAACAAGLSMGCGDDSGTDAKGIAPDTLATLGGLVSGSWWLEEAFDTTRSSLDSNNQHYTYQTYAHRRIRSEVFARVETADSLVLYTTSIDTYLTPTGTVDHVTIDTTYTIEVRSAGRVYTANVVPVYQDVYMVTTYAWSALPFTVGSTWATQDTAMDTIVRYTVPLIGQLRVRADGGITGSGRGASMVSRPFDAGSRNCIVRTTLDTGRVVVTADSAIVVSIGPAPVTLADVGDTLKVITMRSTADDDVSAELPASLWRREVRMFSDTTAFYGTMRRDTVITVTTLKMFCTSLGDTLVE